MFFGFLLSEALLSEPRFTGFKDLPDLPEQQERSSTNALPSVCYTYLHLFAQGSVQKTIAF